MLFCKKKKEQKIKNNFLKFFNFIQNDKKIINKNKTKNWRKRKYEKKEKKI